MNEHCALGTVLLGPTPPVAHSLTRTGWHGGSQKRGMEKGNVPQTSMTFFWHVHRAGLSLGETPFHDSSMELKFLLLEVHCPVWWPPITGGYLHLN